jgi:transcriptional regulator with XRE-family HTH domain
LEGSLADFLPLWQIAPMVHLRDWRKRQGLTQQALAEALGLTSSAITKYEKGSQRPRPDLARRIEALTKGEVTASSLLGLDEPTKRVRGVREESQAFASSPVITIQVPVPPEQAKLLRDSGIAAAKVARAGAQKALKEAEAKAWADANRDAIEASNAWIEKYGTFAEQLGLI